MKPGLTLSGSKLADYPDGKSHSTQLCNSLEHDQLIAWMESLPAGKYPAIDAFATDGHFKPSDAMELQLNAAALAYDPATCGAAVVVKRLLGLIGTGYPDEDVAIDLQSSG